MASSHLFNGPGWDPSVKVSQNLEVPLTWSPHLASIWPWGRPYKALKGAYKALKTRKGLIRLLRPFKALKGLIRPLGRPYTPL